MKKKKKVLIIEDLPEFELSIDSMPEDSRIFVDKSLEIANYLFRVLEAKDMKQKDLADALGKTEAEVSKWLAGMHNYTLRSLSKIEAALGEMIICTPHHSSFSVRLVYNERKQGGVVDQAINKEHAQFHSTDYAKVIAINKKEAPEKAQAIA